MQELTGLLDEILCEARFDAGRYGVHSASQVRSFHVRGDRAGRHIMSVAIMNVARLIVPEPLLAVLVKRLYRELQAYIDPETQRIGTGLVRLMGGALDSAEPEVTDFARILVRAAAILGSARAAQILLDWIAGEPYRYRMVILLTGVRCEQSLAIEEGVQITQLPTAGSDLEPYLPDSLVLTGMNVLEFLGRAVLSIDGTAGPALYRPTRAHGDRPDWNLRQVWAGGRIPSLATDKWRERISEALSLACDHCVRWTHIWHDVGDLRAFSSFASGHESRDVSSRGDAVNLQQEHLETARNLDAQRYSCAQNGKSLDMAIRRWVSSKRPDAALSDRFVDLRIAFETLYLPRVHTELRFRLAFLGAWHLGADYQERRRYYDLLRNAYDCGSEAVHAGYVKDTPKNREILAASQGACRKAILKRLAETEEPAWDQVDVALGA